MVMLARKMFRDMKHNFGQFFSVFILAMLAMAMYVTFEGHVLSEENARKVFHKECNTADLWVYGESFGKEQLEDKFTICRRCTASYEVKRKCSGLR